MSSDLPVGEILLLGAALMAGGALTGVLSGLFGVGGGGGIVPILYELFGVIGAAEERGSILAGWGEVGLPPGSVGYVSLIGAAAMIPASVLTAPLGVRLAHGMPRRRLEIAFAVVLFLVGLRFLLALFL
jgi:uncharacterized membrane protein YfcA